ncbi:tyrosine-type recombinase/integrase [Shewanella surugensis]|uniref:Tyrosine-type recombinase/integrase n=1 Tax=Shewanella surugensis TaxID=212020 RepID=A0ABT0LGK5_9GAMM|nr:tyrosine-type recombinase/integrase [Shewanella surugensis]MCL1126615.1 tyrosine-type recombinase/integrase [Shewanella surugensis]
MKTPIEHIYSSIDKGDSSTQLVTSQEKFYKESDLPLSILDDYQSAALETLYEISDNTRRIYLSSFSIFEQYCQQHGLNALPADPRTVISFIGQQKETIQSSTGKQLSKQTLTTRLAAIRFYHIQAGFHSPSEHPLVIRVMRGLSRNQHRQTTEYDQQPIMYDELELLLQVIDKQPQLLTRVRDKAILQLGLQGGFRRSELASIEVGHIAFLRDKLKVRLPYSKSNQQGQKEWKVLPKSETFSAYDAVKEWIALAKIESGHLFRSLSRDGQYLRPYQVQDKYAQTPISHRQSGFLRGDDIYQVIKKYCNKAGLNADFFGAHSLRSGCVTQLYENDKDHLYIMSRTGHNDPRSLKHYLKPKD